MNFISSIREHLALLLRPDLSIKPQPPNTHAYRLLIFKERCWLRFKLVVSAEARLSLVFAYLVKRLINLFSNDSQDSKAFLASATNHSEKQKPPPPTGEGLDCFEGLAWRCPTFTRESALSSALSRFTVLFGMGRSGTNSLWSSGLNGSWTAALLQSSQFVEFDQLILIARHRESHFRDPSI